MQDTTPAANHRRTDHEAPVVSRVDATWFEETGQQPVDSPLIVLIPIPREPDQDES